MTTRRLSLCALGAGLWASTSAALAQAAALPQLNAGDTAWMLMSTVLVILMIMLIFDKNTTPCLYYIYENAFCRKALNLRLLR